MRPLSSVLLAAVLVLAAAVPAPAEVVVEEVAEGSAGQKAGIEAGDVIDSWSRESAARGEIGTPFDLTLAEMEQAPRGPVTLSGSRAGGAASWTLAPGVWGLKARASLPAHALGLHQQGLELIKEKKVEEAALRWRAAAEAEGDALSPRTAAWLVLRAGRALADARSWEEADRAFADAHARLAAAADDVAAAQVLWEWARTSARRSDWDRAEERFRGALDILERGAPDGFFLTHCLTDLGGVAQSRGHLAKAQELYERALAIREKLAPRSLDVARSLNNLGILAGMRGDIPRAGELFGRALGLHEALAPGSLDVAGTLSNLGIVASQRGELAQAEDYGRRALAIREKLAPESLDLAKSLNGLGNLAYHRGDLAGAESYHGRALAIREKLAPGGLDVAASLNNLGLVAWQRGDFVGAWEHFRRTLAIREKLNPGSLDYVISLNNLGAVAMDRGELEAAEEYHRRALAVREKLAPDSLELAYTLGNLGHVAARRGRLAAAGEYHRRSLEIIEKRAPGSLDAATSLNSLGQLAEEGGDLDAAAEHYRRALAIREKAAPESLALAMSLERLGELAGKRRDLDAATGLLERALAIRERLAPGSAALAETLHALGMTRRDRGEAVAAAEYFARALDALERQRARLGGAEEVRAAYGARYADYYRDGIDALLGLGRAAEAFELLERSRARELLAMLAERDLRFEADLPPDLARERTLLDAEYDRVQAQVARASGGASEVEPLLGRLRELRDRREEMAARIRRASPRFASLQYPEPLDHAAARRALDRGTVLLSYSVGKDATLLFVLRPEEDGAPAVFEIPVGREELSDKVAAFGNVLARREGGDTLAARARALFELLMGPAARAIDRAERLLVLPDGPLHALPFAALARADQRGRTRYLVESAPIHSVVSATVYAELKKARPATPDPSPPRLVAFGDPSYPKLGGSGSAAITGAVLRDAVERGLSLAPLPQARQEVESIARLFPQAASTFVGDAATEERAKSVGRDVRYLHFACHGLLDRRSPLDSALALAMSDPPGAGKDNGLLQAWEILESFRLDADLVTLSACQTGLGREVAGEGLIGLTRAFQYAGARSVLASLWSVADASTADLMKRFYRYLRKGNPKDQALRLAQVDLIEREAHPFAWAAFQLVGDWR